MKGMKRMNNPQMKSVSEEKDAVDTHEQWLEHDSLPYIQLEPLNVLWINRFQWGSQVR